MTATGSPPAALTTAMAPPPSGVKTIRPDGLQLPPRPRAEVQIRSGKPPATSTFMSAPSTKNATQRLSGDQNG